MTNCEETTNNVCFFKSRKQQGDDEYMIGRYQRKPDEMRHVTEKDGGDMSRNNDEIINLTAGITKNPGFVTSEYTGLPMQKIKSEERKYAQ